MAAHIIASMRRVFRNMFGEEAQEETGFAPDDHRVAIAALAVHAIRIDGAVGEGERATLRGALKDMFTLTDSETEELIEAARERDLQAVDLYGFTSVIKRALDEDGRRDVIEMLWALAHADGQVHEFEDNLVWRVAELLGISSRDRIRLRKRVETESGSED